MLLNRLMKTCTFLLALVTIFFISIEIYAWSSDNYLASTSQTLQNQNLNLAFMPIKEHFYINRIINILLIILLIFTTYFLCRKPRHAVVPSFFSSLLIWNGNCGSSGPASTFLGDMLRIYQDSPKITVPRKDSIYVSTYSPDFEWFYNELKAPELLANALLLILVISLILSIFAFYLHRKKQTTGI